MEILKLPVGIENFEDTRRSGFYYIDKTTFIEQFLNTWEDILDMPIYIRWTIEAIIS